MAPKPPPAKRNPGCAFDADWVASVRVNRSAVERRADTLPKRRTVKKEWQAAWLLRAIQTIDLTTLSGDDTPGTVQRLCAKARQPVREDLLRALEVPPGSGSTWARCACTTRWCRRPSRRCGARASRWRPSPPASRPGSIPSSCA